MNPKISVVILAHNNYSDTEECLKSVVNINYAPLSIWLVDNGSIDGTGQLVSQHFPYVNLIETNKNLGVAGGFNVGIIQAVQAKAEYILILNNDTVVESDIIQVFLSVARENRDFGILMPKILYYSDRNRIWSIGAKYRYFPPSIVMLGRNKIDSHPYDKPRLLEYAPSCGLFIPTQIFREVGLFDDGYFFFYDDWDYSIRVRQAGYKIAYIPRARLYHKVSRTIQHRGKSPFFWRTWGQSGARFYRRHGKMTLLSAFIHLTYIGIRETILNGLSPTYYFFIGIIEGLNQPMNPYPNLPNLDK